MPPHYLYVYYLHLLHIMLIYLCSFQKYLKKGGKSMKKLAKNSIVFLTVLLVTILNSTVGFASDYTYTSFSESGYTSQLTSRSFTTNGGNISISGTLQYSLGVDVSLQHYNSTTGTWHTEVTHNIPSGSRAFNFIESASYTGTWRYVVRTTRSTNISVTIGYFINNSL